jgi:uncharacterized protein YutE (UPF0331/DUF86 family)
MANKEIILQFINLLKDYLQKLEELKVHSEEEFLNNWRIYWEIDHGLHLAIQTAIDLSREIITASNFRKPRNYKETFIILRENKIISSEIAQEMQNLAGFRNRLIHEYLFLDPKKTYETFQGKLIYLENFTKEVLRYLKSH